MADNYLVSKLKVHVAIALLGLCPAGVSVAQSVGSLALFQRPARATYSRALEGFSASAAVFGCEIRREGTLSGAQGSLALPDANRFLLLKCDSRLLGAESGRAALQSFSRSLAGLVFLEGDAEWPSAEAGSAVTERAYLIKLSRFNNDAIDAREAALASLGRAVAERPNAYANEAVIAVDAAWGIPRPDDVTVLYYPSPADGKAFRERNPDLLDRIGKFNAEHISEFVYLTGVAAR